ncbi:MAG: ferrous iron transport protein A [Clostridia bacterium]|nr:ferrous iron transport protein A [Clostridia bacterium]
MSLSDVKLNTNCVVKSVNIKDEKTKIRLMELGLIEGSIVQVNRHSVLKKTLLIVFNSNYFTLKDNLAREIVVNYA